MRTTPRASTYVTSDPSREQFLVYCVARGASASAIGVTMRPRRVLLTCLLTFLLCIAGCYESLVSIATPDKVVFYEDLVGEYKSIDPATGRMVLSKDKGNRYAYKRYNDQGALDGEGTLHIVKLGNEHFWELTADRLNTADGKPVFGIGRLVIGARDGAKTLTSYAMKSPEKLFDDPAVKTVEYTYKENGE